MKLDKEKIEQYYYKGLLRKALNPTLELVQIDYTPEATYRNEWDEILSMCRGIIVDKDYNVVCPCMSKFFNFSQLSPEEQKKVVEQEKNFIITEKYDGCLVFIYYYKGAWRINSKCSFDSFVITAAKKIFERDHLDEKLDKNVCYIGECISPATHILVEYGSEENIYFITGFKENKEIEWDEFKAHCEKLGIIRVQETNMSFDELLKWQKDHDWTSEGFVVRIKGSNYRVKFKSEDYLRVAKLKENLNIKHLVDLAITSSDDWQNVLHLVIVQLPDELQPIGKELVWQIKENYRVLNTLIQEEIEKTKNMTDKELGLSDNKYKTFIFMSRRGKSLDKNIFKMIKESYKNEDNS